MQASNAQLEAPGAISRRAKAIAKAMEAVKRLLSSWLPSGYESLQGTAGSVLQPPADCETLLYYLENVELGRPAKERALFQGEELNWSVEDVVSGTLLVTDYRVMLVAGLVVGEALVDGAE